MNVFDIIGPVMVGPSSSHTAGAVRLGLMARSILGEEPVHARIMLHGSFAHTYKGHGTDKALVAGLLGMPTDDLLIRDSLELAQKRGLETSFECVELMDAHPNSVLMELKGISGKRAEVLGWSVGGGNILIKRINGMEVEISGDYATLLINHEDKPGAVAAVSSILAQKGVNIAGMKVYRSNRGGRALMVIETDQPVNEELLNEIRLYPKITGAEIIPAVR